MKKCDVFKAISQFLGALGSEKKNKADKSSIVQKFSNTMYKTNPVRVTGSGNPLCLESWSQQLLWEKRDKAEKAQEQLCCALQHKGPHGGGWGFQIRSQSYTKRDQLTSSTHDPVVMSWRVLLEEFRKLREVRLLPRGFLNQKQNNRNQVH